MISLILGIPAFVLLVLLIVYFFSSEERQDKMEVLFDLNSVLVTKVFMVVVFVSVGLSVLNFILPLSSVLGFVTLVENLIGILWFVKCLFSGKVTLWYEIVKNKVVSFRK